ncbi:MAG TPA: hypothetical protein VMX14_03845 [Anaerolineae bacterium]|nr:hypothetical protein [Anaerolineae bacterium]HUW08151.1 hypothetical protein [Anaerolineae bacterium]
MSDELEVLWKEIQDLRARASHLEAIECPIFLALTGGLCIADGNKQVPGLRFCADPDTGFFRLGDNQIGILVGGVQAGYWGPGLNVGTVTVPAGVGDVALQDDLLLEAGGVIDWGGGTGNLYRNAPGELKTDNAFSVGGLLSVASSMMFGADVGLFRSAADVLRTNDTLIVGAGLNVGTSGAGTGDAFLAGRIRGITSTTAIYDVTEVAIKGPADNTMADLMVFTAPSAPANSIYRSLCNGFLLVSVTGRTTGGSSCAISRTYFVTVTGFASNALVATIQQVGTDNISGIGGTLTVSQKAGATGTSLTIEGKVTFATFSSCVLGAHFVDFSIATSDVCLLTPAAA